MVRQGTVPARRPVRRQGNNPSLRSHWLPMPYLIRDKEHVDVEVRRVFGEQVHRARALLADWRANPRDNVHQARQAFKRIRALLRLIRPGARYVYRVENMVFRDLARSLAYARDTEAVVEALGLLDGRVTGPLAQESLRMLRHGLQQRASRERDCGILDLQGRIESACAALDEAAARLRAAPLESLRRKHLRRGAQRTVDACRDGFRRASGSGAPEDLHEWRRDVKYAYHQTRLLDQVIPAWARAAGPVLGTLAEILGHHQDLTILDHLLRTQADELNIDVHLRAIRNALRDAREDLAGQALRTGAGLFDGTAGAEVGPVAELPRGA